MLQIRPDAAPPRLNALDTFRDPNLVSYEDDGQQAVTNLPLGGKMRPLARRRGMEFLVEGESLTVSPPRRRSARLVRDDDEMQAVLDDFLLGYNQSRAKAAV